MLTTQGGLFEQALIEGGVNPLAANVATAAFANCAQPLGHRGPVRVDLTPPEFRFVTPELRKFRFPNLDGVSGEMPKRRRPSEEPPPEEDLLPQPPEQENQSLRPDFQPTYRDDYNAANFSVSAGPYINVSNGNRVALNASGGNGDVATFQGNRLVGLKLDIKSDDTRLLKVERGALNFTLKPQGEFATVITGISIEGERLAVTARRCFLLGVGAEIDASLDLEHIEYVTDVEDGGSGLTFKRSSQYVLGSPQEDAPATTINVIDCVV